MNPACARPLLLPVLTIFMVMFGSATRAHASSRPDQVLVLFNADWTEDLDGSEPGQDSEEIARYYVRARTDPKTGRKPWILGLSSGVGAASPLNQPVLRERSADNRLGLEYLGKDELVAEPWPLSTRHGNATVPAKLIESGRAGPRYAAFFLSRADLDAGATQGFRVIYEPPDRGPALLADIKQRGGRRHPSVSILGRPEGTLVTVDLLALRVAVGRLRVIVTRADTEPIDLTADLARLTSISVASLFVPLEGEEAGQTLLPSESGAFPRLLTLVDLVRIMGTANLSGILVTRDEMEAIDPDTLVLQGADRLNAENRVDFYRAEDGHQTPGVSVWKLTKGGLLLSGDFSMQKGGSVDVTVSAKRKDEDATWTRRHILHDLRDFKISETGPDGIRDDAVFLETIANPVREFLETHETEDGIPLKDHVLYIVVVHGLPLQVRSLYGIHRGVTAGRPGDMGAGSSLTQRIQTLYYDLPALGLRPGIVPHRGRDGISRPVIGNPLQSALTGPQANPYLHPLTHRSDARNRAWKDGGVESLRKLNPEPFTTELRAEVGEARFLYGSGRIDSRSVQAAKAQIDGAIYAERYLTPKLGPSFLGSYQEAPLTAKALEARGFEVKPAKGRADRALFYFGVFGYGASYSQDVGESPKTSVFWEKGFYPGSIGYGIRSFLGWERRRPPSSKAQLFEQVLRGGATVTAGSAGGAHDTNLTWPDSLVLTHLLFEGYELGDALLRSSIYLDWTLSMVGDPLYSPDLSKTTPDTAPPEVASKEAIRAAVVRSGPDTFALRIDVDLANEGPEMVETRVRCWTEERPDEALAGKNPHFTRRPTAFALPLEPETTYLFAVELIDPCGNRFDSEKSFGPLEITTPKSSPVRTVHEQKLVIWPGKLEVSLYDAEMRDSGEIELTFVPEQNGGIPEIRAASGYRLLSGGAFTIGGAAAELKDAAKLLKQGVSYRMILRWRRFPTTREVYLVAPGGSEHLFACANNLPWRPDFELGTSLRLSGPITLKEIAVRDEAPAASEGHRTALPPRFDAGAFRESGGDLTD